MDYQSRSKLAVALILALGVLGVAFSVYKRYGRMPGNFASVDIVERAEKPASGSDPMPDLSAGIDSTAEAPPSAAPASEVVVHVAGMVKKSGVYHLAPGARVVDAIKMAGGPKDSADLDSINLAARPQDGEQIYVPEKGAAPPVVLEEPSSGSIPAASASSISPSRARASQRSGARPPRARAQAHSIVNINKASADQLDTLPGVGPSTAASILEYRKAVGGFARVEDLINVRGIGEKKFAQMKPWITVK